MGAFRKKIIAIATVLAVVTTGPCTSRSVNINNSWLLPENGFPVFYRHFKDSVTWFEADAVCQFHHAQLVTVESSSQFEAIRDYLMELGITEDVWIGLKRNNEASLFTWTNYQPLTRRGYFGDEIPSTTDPICVVIDPKSDFRWHTLRCGGPEVASFVCELPVPYWATRNNGCMTRMVDGMSITFLPESPAVLLTQDCIGGVSRNVTCKGNMKPSEILERLSCAGHNQLPDSFKPIKPMANERKYETTSTTEADVEDYAIEMATIAQFDEETMESLSKVIGHGSGGIIDLPQEMSMDQEPIRNSRRDGFDVKGIDLAFMDAAAAETVTPAEGPVSTASAAAGTDKPKAMFLHAQNAFGFAATTPPSVRATVAATAPPSTVAVDTVTRTAAGTTENSGPVRGADENATSTAGAVSAFSTSGRPTLVTTLKAPVATTLKAPAAASKAPTTTTSTTTTSKTATAAATTTTARKTPVVTTGSKTAAVVGMSTTTVAAATTATASRAPVDVTASRAPVTATASRAPVDVTTPKTPVAGTSKIPAATLKIPISETSVRREPANATAVRTTTAATPTTALKSPLAATPMTPTVKFESPNATAPRAAAATAVPGIPVVTTAAAAATTSEISTGTARKTPVTTSRTPDGPSTATATDATTGAGHHHHHRRHHQSTTTAVAPTFTAAGKPTTTEKIHMIAKMLTADSDATTAAAITTAASSRTTSTSTTSSPRTSSSSSSTTSSSSSTTTTTTSTTSATAITADGRTRAPTATGANVPYTAAGRPSFAFEDPSGSSSSSGAAADAVTAARGQPSPPTFGDYVMNVHDSPTRRRVKKIDLPQYPILPMDFDDEPKTPVVSTATVGAGNAAVRRPVSTAAAAAAAISTTAATAAPGNGRPTAAARPSAKPFFAADGPHEDIRKTADNGTGSAAAARPDAAGPTTAAAAETNVTTAAAADTNVTDTAAANNVTAAGNAAHRKYNYETYSERPHRNRHIIRPKETHRHAYPYILYRLFG